MSSYLRNGWRVLLIGGNSAVGKSTAAQAIGDRSACTVTDLDFNLSGGSPDWYALAAAPPSTPPNEFFAIHRRCQDDVTEPLAGWVADALRDDAPHVAEGVWITPELARRLGGDPRVAVVFVVDHDYEFLLSSRVSRQTPSRAPDRPDRDRLYARVSAIHAEWLESQAVSARLRLVQARPLSTLVDRILFAAEGANERSDAVAK